MARENASRKFRLLRIFSILVIILLVIFAITLVFNRAASPSSNFQRPNDSFFSDSAEAISVMLIKDRHGLPFDTIQQAQAYTVSANAYDRLKIELLQAKNDYDRNKNLYTEEVIAKKEFDRSKKHLDSAKKRLEIFLLSDSNSTNNIGSLHYEIDTIIQKIQKKSAILGYSYPVTLLRSATDYINVFVTISHPERLVRDTLEKISKSQNIFHINNDTVVIYPNNIFLYKFLTVTLLDPNGDFKMTPVHDSNRQEIDTIAGNSWRWSLTTTTTQPSARLILKVTAESAGSATIPLQQTDIPIKVLIDNSNYGRRIWIYLTDNLGWTLGGIATLITGIFSFYALRFYNRKDKQKEKKESPPPRKLY